MKTTTMIAAIAMALAASCAEYKTAAEAYAAKDYNALVTKFKVADYSSMLKAVDADGFIEACIATTNRVILANVICGTGMSMTPTEAAEKVLQKNGSPMFAAYVLCRGAQFNNIHMNTNSLNDVETVKIAKAAIDAKLDNNAPYSYVVGYGFEESLRRGDIGTFKQYYQLAKEKGANACVILIAGWNNSVKENHTYIDFLAQELASPNIFDNANTFNYFSVMYINALCKMNIRIPYYERLLKYDSKITRLNQVNRLIYAPIEYREKAVGTVIKLNEFQTTDLLFNVCKWADEKIAKSKKYTLENVDRFAADKAVQIAASLYLNDNDMLIDVLVAGFGNNLSAETVNSIVAKINTFDSVYRADDVKKILKDINKKYTLKLYDDRDTWEPILSKVRALLDVY